MLNILKKTILGAGAVVLATAALPASATAQPGDVVVTADHADVLRAEVSYAGMDLRNQAAVARLARLVRSAVNQVCPIENHLNLIDTRLAAACRSEAQREASAQVEQAVAVARSGQYAAGGGAIRVTAR